jgi:hypothetical protein
MSEARVMVESGKYVPRVDDAKCGGWEHEVFTT